MQAARTLAFERARHNLTQEFRPSDGNHRLVVLDDTFHLRSMRGQSWRVAREFQAAYIQVHVRCPLEIALHRNRNRSLGSRVPDKVVMNAFNAFEDPAHSPCPWDRDYTIYLDTSISNDGGGDNGIPIAGLNEERLPYEVDGTALWHRIWDEYWRGPVPASEEMKRDSEREAARRATAEDCVHQVDVRTRHALTTVLNQIALGEKSALAASLNEIRREMMNSFRRKVAAYEQSNFAVSSEEVIAVAEAEFVQACNCRLGRDQSP